jgi:hypothetical protein
MINTNSDLAKQLMSISDISKEEIIGYYEKPDLVDRIGPYVIVKKLLDNGKAVLMTIDAKSNEEKLMSIYLIHSSFLQSDIGKITPMKMLGEFMEVFGKVVNTPFGSVKSLIDFDKKIFFEGVLDLGLYQEALKRLT